MFKHVKNAALRALSFALCGLLLVACSGGGGSAGGEFESNGKPILQNPEASRDVNNIRLTAYSGAEQASHEDPDRGYNGLIDYSNASQGYVTAAVNSGGSARFQVEYPDGTNYNYIMGTDGSYQYFPLARGNGSYTLTIFLATDTEGMYETYLSQQVNVTLDDEFAPFLIPSKIVDYNESSSAITLAKDLALHCSDNLEVAKQVYYWICDNITYDEQKALTVTGTEYVPNLDQVLSSGSGICYDYASLAAAMLRSMGIPTKLVMGNVRDGEDGTIYHAWNEVWTEDAGWIAVGIPASSKSWNHIDLTFAAAGGSAVTQFIGDGSNYYETSYH